MSLRRVPVANDAMSFLEWLHEHRFQAISMRSNDVRPDNVSEEVIYLGTEQPETCRWCGARTDFDVLPSGQQVHQCLNCAKRYVVEFDESWEY